VAVRLTPRRFERLVASAVDALPVDVLAVLENVAVMVQEWPSRDQLEYTEEGDRYGLLGLYEGVPQTERDGYNMALPDRITLFQRPLEAVCGTRDELAEEVRVTVVHEIAHHLGWTDADLERLGYD
jgi:predicted Zn-dependent protease with MMP-like domain